MSEKEIRNMGWEKARKNPKTLRCCIEIKRIRGKEIFPLTGEE